MPQAGSLPPPTSETAGSLRQVSTAPNLAGMMQMNRYSNLDMDSPMIMGSPPHPGLMTMKFQPLTLPSSKYRQLSQLNLSTSPPKIHVDFARAVGSVENQPPTVPPKRSMYLISESTEHSASLQNFDLLRSTKKRMYDERAQKPSFSVGPQDEYDGRSGCSSRSDVPMLSVQTCDTPTGTPHATPQPSPQLNRKRASTPHMTEMDRKPSGGFLGWLTRSSTNGPVQPEAEFFHQKEDMSSIQGAPLKSSIFKQRPKMPVSLSDINVFTPSEY